VEPVKRLRNFSKSCFATRKALAKEMRVLLDEVAWLKKNKITAVDYSGVAKSRGPVKMNRGSYTLRTVKDNRTKSFNRRSYTPARFLELCKTKNTAYCVINDKTLEKDKAWAYFFDTDFNIKVYFVISSIGDLFKEQGVSSLSDLIVQNKSRLEAVADKLYVQANYKDYDMYHKLFKANGVATSLKVLGSLKTNHGHGGTRGRIPADFSGKFSPKQEVVDAVQELNSLVKKYPLLKMAQSHYLEKEDYKALEQYVELIDNQIKKEGVV
jgi:hypothetical protein